jgi:major type 1 subunit fimbrin (pilin)
LLKQKFMWTLLTATMVSAPLTSQAQVAPGSPVTSQKPASSADKADAAKPAVADKVATGGTITFKGEITSPTCVINGGNGGENFSVDLPKVSTADLRDTGKTAGETKFNVSLSGCGYTGGKVRTHFQEGASVDARTGRLKLQDTDGANSAANVQVELANADGKAINIGDDQSTSYFPIDDTGAAKMDYVARYYATGKAKAGMVRSQVTYVLQYE